MGTNIGIFATHLEGKIQEESGLLCKAILLVCFNTEIVPMPSLWKMGMGCYLRYLHCMVSGFRSRESNMGLMMNSYRCEAVVKLVFILTVPVTVFSLLWSKSDEVWGGLWGSRRCLKSCETMDSGTTCESGLRASLNKIGLPSHTSF